METRRESGTGPGRLVTGTWLTTTVVNSIALKGVAGWERHKNFVFPNEPETTISINVVASGTQCGL